MSVSINMQWDAATYDDKHHFVSDYGTDVVALLDPKPNERILDLGCGTGRLTQLIADSGASVLGFDASSDMLRQARANFPKLDFQLGNAAEMSFRNEFHAVFSNAALHWMLDAQRVARCVAAALKPGGRFVAEMGGKGNIDAVISALLQSAQANGFEVSRPNKFYPSIGEYATLLESEGLEIDQMRRFPRPTPLPGEDGLRIYYHQFGKLILDAIPAAAWDDVIAGAENALRATHFADGVWTADYVRLRFQAHKPA